MIKPPPNQHRLSLLQAGSIFFLFTIWFYLLIWLVIPFLKANYSLNPALHWFIVGYLLFIPIFGVAIWGTLREGNRTLLQVMTALRLKQMTRSDWKYAISATVIIIALNGLIMGISAQLHSRFGIPLLDTSPSFMEFEPFVGRAKLLLLVWFPMFFFNILGEEFLWRGYIQTRMGSREKHFWPILSIFWLIFHLPFGLNLLIMLLPCMIILPWAVYKTKNTWVGVAIHGIYNGPMFVLVALGVVR